MPLEERDPNAPPAVGAMAVERMPDGRRAPGLAPIGSAPAGVPSVQRDRQFGVRTAPLYQPPPPVAPDVAARAQAELDAAAANTNPPVPPVAYRAREAGMSVPDFIRSGMSQYGEGPEAERVAAALEARDARRQQQAAAVIPKAIEMAAARIGRLPPDQWQAEIERYNRRAKSNGRAEAGLVLTPDDIARATGRDLRAVPPTGIIGTAPDIVGGTDRQGGRQPRGASGLIQTNRGAYRPQIVAGKPVGVPVMDIEGASVPNPYDLNPEEWANAYTAEDAAVVGRTIVRSGVSDWSIRQRQIDAARAALTDGTLTPAEQAEARAEIEARENELHREWIMSEGMRIGVGGGVGGMLGQDDLDPQGAEERRTRNIALNRRAREIMQDNPDIPIERAREIAESEGTDNPIAYDRAPKKPNGPDEAAVNRRAREIAAEAGVSLAEARKIAASEWTDNPIEVKPKAAERKPETFDYEGFRKEYDAEIASMTKALSGPEDTSPQAIVAKARGQLAPTPTELTPEQRSKAFDIAMKRSGGATVSRKDLRRSLEADMDAIASDSEAGEPEIRAIVLKHLPLFSTFVRDPDDEQGMASAIEFVRAQIGASS